MKQEHPFPPVLKDRVAFAGLGTQRLLTVLGQWLGALLPCAVVLGGGLLVFRQAVVASILATPHPELVYAILGAYGVGVVLTSVTLWRYTYEGNVLHRWTRTLPHQRMRWLKALRWKSYLQPLYDILLGQRRLQGSSAQQVIEHEMAALAQRFNDRLSMPHYLAGALVGLGLVGTFVGLLGTLQDLGQLFGGLVQNSADNSNPADLFSDMVRRLQDPMRGMGTAFVASLYGLLGSLVLGLQILVVGKIGQGVMHQLQREMRSNDHRIAVSADSHAPSHSAPGSGEGPPRAPQALQEWQALLRLQQTRHQQETESLRRELLHVIQSCQAQTRQVLQHVTQTHEQAWREQTQQWEAQNTAWRDQCTHLLCDMQWLVQEASSVNQTHQSIASDVLSDMAITLQNIEQRLRESSRAAFH